MANAFQDDAFQDDAFQEPAGGGTTINVDTPGQFTYTGQGIGLRVTVTPTPGAITWAGQTLPLRTRITPTPGAVTWAGQTVGLTNRIIPTPGAVTWTGSSTITLVSGGDVTLVVDVAGAVTWSGQTIGLTTRVTPTPGALTWAGSSIPLRTRITPTGGAITWAGQTLPLRTRITPVAGAITWTGSSSIVLVAGGTTTVNVDIAGSVTWAGQTIGLRTRITPTPGAITWSGQTVTTARVSRVDTPGAITWTGQTLPLRITVGVTAGAVIWTGSEVTVVNTGLELVFLSEGDVDATSSYLEAGSSSGSSGGSAYSLEVMADAPVAYWRLGESSGLVATDSSGNGQDGTYNATGVTYSVEGALEDGTTGVTLDGATWVDIPAGVMNLATSTSPKTLEVWFKTTATTAALIGCRNAAGTPVFDLGVGHNGATGDPGKLTALIRSDGNTLLNMGFSTALANDGGWHHAVLTYGVDRNVRLYLDGVVVRGPFSSGAGTGYTFEDGWTRIGDERQNGTITNLLGSVDEVAVYGSELSDTRVLAHYQAGIAGGQVGGVEGGTLVGVGLEG